MKPLLDIVIPTLDNPQMLLSCVNSIKLSLFLPIRDMVRIVIINNGNPDSLDFLVPQRNVCVVNAGKNLGWEGGLKLGLEQSTAPFVAFCNDDIRMTPSCQDWFWKMVSLFNDPKIGAVGPSSNFVMGPQNFFLDIMERIIRVRYLIGFFMVLRREALDRAGGVDDTLPGGDDIDLSIRLKDAGYDLVARRDVFVFHHGQATGLRLHQGYWNSPKMQEKTNMAIIKKHGMSKFYQTMVMGSYMIHDYEAGIKASTDVEGDLCRKHVAGDAVLELGCGGRKTHEKSVGVDRFPAGYKIPLVTEGKESCIADLNADVSLSLPVDTGTQDTIIARHILEHCQDTLGTMSVWNRALKNGGSLIIAVPNQRLDNTVIMNPEHVVSFTPESLRNLASVCGFAMTHTYEEVNGISFVAVFKKTGAPHFAINVPEPTRHPVGAELIMSEELTSA